MSSVGPNSYEFGYATLKRSSIAPRGKEGQPSMKNAAAIVGVAFAAVLCSAIAEPLCAAAEPLMFGGPTMGTSYQVRVVADGSAIDLARLKRDVESLLAEIDRQMSTYRDDSELSRFNRAPAGVWFDVSRATAKVAAAAQEISRNSDGALDVTVSPLIRLWRFGPKEAGDRRVAFTPPDGELVEAARKLVGYENLEVRRDPPALQKHVSGLEVDLSSIAPGYAVDRIAILLSEYEIKSFLVEIGGEIRSAGRRHDGKPWRVAIERPLFDRREMQTALALESGAISTAGDYRKFFEFGGRRYSHIIDPATGRPVEHALASVTVAAETCLAADGWDTALLVMGPVRGFEHAEKNGIAALFIVRGEERDAVQATSAWKNRFGE
jgi:thiamine biosynthesis lipoprotein